LLLFLLFLVAVVAANALVLVLLAAATVVIGCFVLQENEMSRNLVLEQRLHRLIIGSQGSRIREIREQFPAVSIYIPDYSRKSDIITLRGQRNDVDKCYAYLQKLCHDLVGLGCILTLTLPQK